MFDRIRLAVEKVGSQFEARVKRSVVPRSDQTVRERGARKVHRRPRCHRHPASSAEVGVIPGPRLGCPSAETQILGVTTLNMLRMEQTLDTLAPERTKRYMHNYNMPPYSVGETGRVGAPKRREIGHGALAERAILPVLPSREEFPYAIRQVSEALGSNGSTSMGSVCASTMALLNAGVPLKAPVAGIAMGLIHEDGEYATLTDILGAEDAFGDMDFKVAGTRDYVTALQLDTKLDGIPASVLAAALKQAREARLHILEVMAEAIDRPDDMSPNAPRIITVRVPVDKIGEVIGPKGKVINQIQDETGAEITIEDDGHLHRGDRRPVRQWPGSRSTPSPTRMPQVGERYPARWSRPRPSAPLCPCRPARTACCISQIRKSLVASGLGARTCSRWAEVQVESPRSTRAASCPSCRCSRTGRKRLDARQRPGAGDGLHALSG